MNRLHLHVPLYDELWYRQRMLEDPATMSYNRGYDLAVAGYNRETGCIAFPESIWREWYDRWIGLEPERFYAYLVRSSDGAFLGEVCLRRHESGAWHEMGIVLEACRRGQGYAREGLALLLRHAFAHPGVQAVHNTFEASRAAAAALHRQAGFAVLRNECGLLELCLTREAYSSSRDE